MKLNFGCGSIQPPGWVNVDREDFGQEHIGSTGLFDPNSFDVIVAHCTLQITEYNDVPQVLGGLFRVLKPGGVLRLSLPDIAHGFTAWGTGQIGWFPNNEPNIDDRFSNWLTWYSTTRSLWTPQSIRNRLREAGFTPEPLCRKFGDSSHPVGATLDTREGECFFLEATK